MLTDKIVESISTVQGVKAIALGGSQSRGEADKQSDYDIGFIMMQIRWIQQPLHDV